MHSPQHWPLFVTYVNPGRQFSSHTTGMHNTVGPFEVAAHLHISQFSGSDVIRAPTSKVELLNTQTGNPVEVISNSEGSVAEVLLVTGFVSVEVSKVLEDVAEVTSDGVIIVLVED